MTIADTSFPPFPETVEQAHVRYTQALEVGRVCQMCCDQCSAVPLVQGTYLHPCLISRPCKGPISPLLPPQAIADRFPGENVLVVSHGEVSQPNMLTLTH